MSVWELNKKDQRSSQKVQKVERRERGREREMGRKGGQMRMHESHTNIMMKGQAEHNGH